MERVIYKLVQMMECKYRRIYILNSVHIEEYTYEGVLVHVKKCIYEEVYL